jgi:hypothetical protein
MCCSNFARSSPTTAYSHASVSCSIHASTPA